MAIRHLVRPHGRLAPYHDGSTRPPLIGHEGVDFRRVPSGWKYSCTSIARVMPETLLAKTFSETKRPAIRAIEVLRKHSRVVRGKWIEQLRALGLTPEEYELMTTLDLEAPLRDFQKITFASFRQALASVGDQFAEREVRIGCVVTAFNLLLELSMPYLTEGKMGSEEPALAGVRLWSLAVSIVISGYSKRLQIQQKVLQARLNETARRLHKASAYVTNVYEQERRRLSHDLHDDVGHQLLLLKLYLEMIVTDADKDEYRQFKPKLDEALTLASNAIESIRRMVLDLGPAIFDELGFVQALKFYGRQFSLRTGIQVTVREEKFRNGLPQSHQVAFYRLLQGALSNVMKHAKAEHVKVTLGTANGSSAVMIIEDDGIGFDVSSVSFRSYGLTAMRERVEVLGGTLQVESARPGSLNLRRGTWIQISLPLPPTEQHEQKDQSAGLRRSHAVSRRRQDHSQQGRRHRSRR